MKTITRPIPKLADLPPDECMQLEDQIMERALTLWNKKGHAHRNALNALLQAEREMFALKKDRQGLLVVGSLSARAAH